MRTTGMVAGSLAPPRRPVPSELRIDTTVDAGMVAKLFDVNSHAYGMPLELGQASIRPGLFTNAWCAVGHIDDEPVSVAVTFRVGECLYVAWVATMPARQGRGYAEAVMRRTLADAGAATGLSRTVLHASAAGQPLYAMMGYEPVTAVTFYGHGFEH
jgi:GNAT superfamily N-acetyltransferase